jgi:hypothetical protein
MSLLKPILIGSFGLILAVSICLGISLACVAHSSCTTRCLGIVSVPLAKLGLRVQFKELSFIPWRGLTLAELTLIWSKTSGGEESQVEIQLKSLDVAYSVTGILQKRMHINNVALEGLKIQGKIFLPTEEAEKQDEGDPGKFNLAEFLADPPVELSLANFGVSDLTVDVAIRSPLISGAQPGLKQHPGGASHAFQESRLQIPRLDIQSHASLKKNHLSYFVSLNPPTTNPSEKPREPWKISVRQGEQLTFETQLNMNHEMEGNLLQQDGEVFLSIPKQIHGIELTELAIDVQEFDEFGKRKGATSIRLGSIDLKLSQSLEHLKLPLQGSFALQDVLPVAAQFGQKFHLQSLELQSQVMGESGAISESLISVTKFDQGLTLNHKLGEPSELSLDWQVGSGQFSAPGLPLTWAGVAGTLQAQADGMAAPDGTMRVDVLVDSIQAPGILLKPASLALAFQGHKQSQELKATYGVNLNETKIIQGDLQVQDLDQVAKLQLKGRIGIDGKLQQQLPGLDVLSQIGNLAISFLLNASLEHEAANLGAADLAAWSAKLMRANYSIGIEQLAKPQKAPFLLLLREPLQVSGDFEHRSQEIQATTKIETTWLSSADMVLRDLALALEANYAAPNAGVAVKLSLGSLQLPDLPELNGLELSQKLQATLKPWDLKLKGDVWLSEKKLLQHDLKVTDEPQKVGVVWAFQLWPHAELLSPFAPSAPWESLGRLQLDGEMKAMITHPGADMTMLNPDAISDASLDTKVTITQTEAPALVASQRFLFSAPMQISAATRLSPPDLLSARVAESAQASSKLLQSRLTQTIQMVLPKFHFGDLLALAGTKVDLEVKVPVLTKPDHLVAKLRTQVDTLQIPMGKDGAWNLGAALSPLKSSVDVELAQQQVVLKGLKATLGQVLGLATKGQIQLGSKDGRFEGQAVVDPPKSLNVGADTIAGSGRVQFPWTLVVENGRNLRFEGKSLFSNFSLSAEKIGFSLQRLNGPILVAEDLIYDEAEKRIAFATLLQRNPFQRVDFSRYQPLVQDAMELTFHRLQAAGVEVGPFRGQLQLTQNMLEVNKFDLNLLSGSASGMMYVNLLPKDLALGLLSRITRIDPAELSPGVEKKSERKTISLRTAIELQIPQSMIAGRIDVNEIGSEQILSLIDTLDPKGEDEQLNSARQALRVAYPRAVNIEIKQGLMDMLLSLDSAVVAKDIVIQRFPVYSFMASALSDLTQSLHEVPIQ